MSQTKAKVQELKDLYEIGEIPPLGHVPKNMYAWAIRRDRQGPTEQAMQLENRASALRSQSTRKTWGVWAA